MHYSLQTNCISLSSNANVARTYGEAFSDKYVMIRVPKKEMGERVFHAGPYMLQEIEKIVKKEIEKQNLREDVLKDLKAIDEAKTSDEIKELIKTRYKSKEGIDVSKAGLKKGITYRSPHARISSYQSLNILSSFSFFVSLIITYFSLYASPYVLATFALLESDIQFVCKL